MSVWDSKIELHFKQPLARHLTIYNIQTLGQLAATPVASLYANPHFCPSSILECQSVVRLHGMEMPDSPVINSFSREQLICAVKAISMPIPALELSTRSQHALAIGHFRTVGDILYAWHKLYLVRNLGERSLYEIRRKVEAIFPSDQSAWMYGSTVFHYLNQNPQVITDIVKATHTKAESSANMETIKEEAIQLCRTIPGYDLLPTEDALALNTLIEKSIMLKNLGQSGISKYTVNRNSKIQGFLLYRIFYGEVLVYVGRTKQPLQNRIRGHLFAKPMHRTIAIEQVSKIEYAEFDTEADMNLYEIYYILKWHPPLNVDDKTKDNLTVSLPDVTWKVFHTPLWDKWLEEITVKAGEHEKMLRKYRDYPEKIRILRSARRMGTISEEEYECKLELLKKEQDCLRITLWG